MYNLDFSMDYESDGRSPSTVSAQSPGSMIAAQDTAFVLKHNATAEIYQVSS